jgi:hypothetical protein
MAELSSCYRDHVVPKLTWLFIEKVADPWFRGLVLGHRVLSKFCFIGKILAVNPAFTLDVDTPSCLPQPIKQCFRTNSPIQRQEEGFAEGTRLGQWEKLNCCSVNLPTHLMGAVWPFSIVPMCGQKANQVYKPHSNQLLVAKKGNDLGWGNSLHLRPFPENQFHLLRAIRQELSQRLGEFVVWSLGKSGGSYTHQAHWVSCHGHGHDLLGNL